MGRCRDRDLVFVLQVGLPLVGTMVWVTSEVRGLEHAESRPGLIPGGGFVWAPMERVTNKLMGVTYRRSGSTPEKGYNKSAGISRLIISGPHNIRQYSHEHKEEPPSAPDD